MTANQRACAECRAKVSACGAEEMRSMHRLSERRIECGHSIRTQSRGRLQAQHNVSFFLPYEFS